MNPIMKLVSLPIRNLYTTVHTLFTQKIVFPLMDLVDWKLGKADNLTPPRKLVALSGNLGKFGNMHGIREHGESTIKFIINTVGLERNERVLDVGCGVGVKAIPLAEYMAGEGNYEGFDIVPDQVTWCQQNITPRFPNFHFIHPNIYSKVYNPSGNIESSEFVFPYEKETFDFVFLISVFTHMLPLDMEHYFSEISRVLKVGGRCLISYFLLNPESMSMARKGIYGPEFKHEMSGYWTSNLKYPEYAVAYSEDNVRNLYNRFGLLIKDPLIYGSWCGRERAKFYQDVIVGWKIEKPR
jgi:SAM-dependent methyltransferase